MTFMGRRGRRLVNESFQAWVYGPVLPSLYQVAKVFKDDPITSLPPVTRNLNLPQHAVVREVVNHFGHYSPGELVDLTHTRNGAWYKNYIPRRRNIVIPDVDIKREYEARTSELP